MMCCIHAIIHVIIYNKRAANLKLLISICIHLSPGSQRLITEVMYCMPQPINFAKSGLRYAFAKKKHKKKTKNIRTRLQRPNLGKPCYDSQYMLHKSEHPGAR